MFIIMQNSSAHSEIHSSPAGYIKLSHIASINTVMYVGKDCNKNSIHWSSSLRHF